MYLQRAGRGQTQSWLPLAVAVKMVHEVHPCLTSVARETNSNLPCSSTPRCLVHLHYLKQFIHFHHSLHVCVPLPPRVCPTPSTCVSHSLHVCVPLPPRVCPPPSFLPAHSHDLFLSIHQIHLSHAHLPPPNKSHPSLPFLPTHTVHSAPSPPFHSQDRHPPTGHLVS